jgi:hypothetical protein
MKGFYRTLLLPASIALLLVSLMPSGAVLAATSTVPVIVPAMQA